MINRIMSSPGFYIPFIISILFFFRKGLQYAMIGSYIPLVFILSVLLIFALAFVVKKKILIKVICKTWTIIVMIWSIVRILLSLVHLTLKSLNEFHLSNQFEIWGILLSLVMLSISIFMMKNTSTLYHSDKTLTH